MLSDLLNSEKLGESSKQKLDMNHKERFNEREVHVNKKQSGHGILIRSEDDTNGKGKDEKYREHEMHILTERKRRKKMSNMFSNLHALLPQLPSKVISFSCSINLRIIIA